MDKIIFPIKDELENFENKLKKVVEDNDNFLTDDLKSFLFNNPKRLRPIFTFLFSKILKIKNPLVLDIALITELIHNASLIHDDIIDEEKTRRNHPTFYEKYGSKIAVLEGDLLLSLALEQISKTNQTISQIFALHIKKTIQGEIKQNENLNKITDLETYFQKTKDKTANLFFASLECLFNLSDKNQYLYDFLDNFTLAFQIKNDLKDLKSDFKNGNYTLPMIYSFMETNKIEIDTTKFIQKSQIEIQKLKTKAINHLKNFEDSIYKVSLIKLTNKILEENKFE